MAVFKRRNKDGEEGETWYVDYRDPTGKRVIKAIGPSKREAQDYLGKVKASIREGRFFDMKKENKTMFNELLDAYIEKMTGQKYFETSIKYFTGSSERNEEGQYKEVSPLRKRFGGKLISEIDYKALEERKNSEP